MYVYIYIYRQAPGFARQTRLTSRMPSYLHLQPLDGGLPSGGFLSKQRIGQRGLAIEGLVSFFRGIWEPPTYGLTEAVWATIAPAQPRTRDGRSTRAIASAQHLGSDSPHRRRSTLLLLRCTESPVQQPHPTPLLPKVPCNTRCWETSQPRSSPMPTHTHILIYIYIYTYTYMYIYMYAYVFLYM